MKFCHLINLHASLKKKNQLIKIILVYFLPLLPGTSELNFSVITIMKDRVRVRLAICCTCLLSPAVFSWFIHLFVNTYRMVVMCWVLRHWWTRQVDRNGCAWTVVLVWNHGGLEECWRWSCRDVDGFRVCVCVESSRFADTWSGEWGKKRT